MSTNAYYETLPTLKKTVTIDQIKHYSRASGDRNPIHLDAEFAAQSSFGKIVAHGMLTLAFLSEMMTHAFGMNWLENGKLKVRFRKPAYPGDNLHTWGQVTKDTLVGDGRALECAIALFNSSDEEIIIGSAAVYVPISPENAK